ncbi:hypothetical protein QYE76_029149 [Lolium multiflorum]|uniref:Gnk2-homologous domain-containing protein n=1 Tax=Lolium multiflorum TaxID=4521 RepID=A0AAD8QMA4_LOLMU|nr:hypothetical protein QYE76_029149 [Lolium multiflorum]
MSWSLAAAAALPILSLLVACARGADDYTAFVYAGCSQARYDAGTQYAADVGTVLSALSDSAGSSTYATYKPPSGAATGLVGLYQCRSDLPAAVCGVCVKASVSKLSSLCNSAVGGAVQLRACFLRYGNDSFVGKQDTTVLFKKCGGESDGADAGVAALRDGALGALPAASSPAGEGSFRAGASGYVQAMSQCVGDLDDKACTDCVSAAAGQLKVGCNNAPAGEVYLGKCYARFWSNAGTGGAPGGGASGVIGGNGGIVGDGGGAVPGTGGYGFVPRTYNDVQDGSEKNIAIIIGIVAAIAIVIVFAVFLRRSRAANGKI